MVKFLDYNGKKIPVRVSYYALKMFKVATGKSLELVSQDQDFKDYEVLLYFSLQKGFKVTGQEFAIDEKPVTLEMMEDIMDVVFFEFMKIIPEFFQQGKGPKK